MKTLILVNRSARKGGAGEVWRKIEKDVIRSIPGNPIVEFYSPPTTGLNGLNKVIDKRGLDCLISAGGDGSLHHLINHLLTTRPHFLASCLFGAIGLGSSNDFLKPFSSKIRGVPVRINTSHHLTQDLGRVRFKSSGINKTRLFLINAALGVTAEANQFFNRGNRMFDNLQRRFTGIAILWAAIRTILGYRNFEAQLQFNGMHKSVALSNLSVIKNPSLSGNMRYDQAIQPNDGQFGLNYCSGMNKLELIQTLLDLNNGQFTGKPKRSTYSVTALRVLSGTDVPLETDGEVVLGNDFRFDILPGALKTLGH